MKKKDIKCEISSEFYSKKVVGRMLENKKRDVSVKKNYLYNLSYQILTIFVPLVTTPYVARVLGASGNGVYSFMLSTVTYFALFSSLGLTTYGQLHTAKCRDDKYELSCNFWGITIAKCATTLFCLINYIIVGLATNQQLLYFLFSISLLAVLFDIGWLFQGLEEFKLTVLRNFFVKTLSSILIFTFVRHTEDLGKYIVIVHGSTLIGNLSLWSYLRNKVIFVPIKKLKITRHWKKSVVYFIPTVATSIYTVLGKSMIGWITKSSAENGYFEQAYKIEQMFVMIVTSISIVLLPRVTYLYMNNQKDKAKQYLQNSLDIIILIASPIVIGVISVATILVPWYLGNGYENCVLILRIFSFLVLIIGLNNAVGMQGLMAQNKQKYYNYGVILGAISNFILNLLLIHPFGSAGAAIASVIAETIILITFIYFARDSISITKLIRSSIKYVTISLIMGVIVYIASLYVTESVTGLMELVLLGVVIYAIELLLIKDKICIHYLKMLKEKFK